MSLAQLQDLSHMRLEWHIGDIVEKLREQSGLGQKELAAASGVSVATIGRVEAGREAEPDTIKKLAGGLGVRVSELYAALEVLVETQRSAAASKHPPDAAGEQF